MTPVGTSTPRGILVFTSRLVREWGPAVARRELAEYAEMRAAGVVLCAEASDGWVAQHGVLVDVADHLRGAGLAVLVYTLTGDRALDEPEAAADRLAAAGIACGASSWIGDIEEHARGRGRAVRRFVSRLTDRASERYSVGLTSYGMVPETPRVPVEGDGHYPWADVVGHGYYIDQVYQSAGDRRLVRRRLASSRRHWGGDVIPALATYERRDGRHGAAALRDDLERTCLDDEGRVDVPAVAIWQDSTTDAAERRVLAEWAQRIEDASLARPA